MIIAMIIAKTAEKLLRFFKSGATTLPGKIALMIKKNILFKLSQGVKVIMVTGTNGKTTSARMIEQGLKESGKSYFMNRSGANLQGYVNTICAEAVWQCRKAICKRIIRIQNKYTVFHIFSTSSDYSTF